jgi:CRP-like cAMP-binding protein
MTVARVEFLDDSAASGIGPPAIVSANSLLASLPEPFRSTLRPHCDRVALSPGERLFHGERPSHPMYFPESGAIGLFHGASSGNTIQVALIDRHGLAGLPALDGAPLIPCDAVAQLPGTAVRVRLAALPLVVADRSFQQMLQRHLYELLVSSMQLAVCNALHRVEQRTARWLLALSDIAGDEFPLTHDNLSTMLGVRRPSVTLSAIVLQHLGAIEYRHGRMRIRNRAILEQSACECYRTLRALRSHVRTEDI